MASLYELQAERDKIDTLSGKITRIRPESSELSSEFTRINDDILVPILDIIKEMGGNKGKYGLGTVSLEELITNSIEGSKNIESAFSTMTQRLSSRRQSIENEIQSLSGTTNKRSTSPVSIGHNGSRTSTGCSWSRTY